MATLKDIAKETGLSVATISKYINGVKLKDKNRLAVERAIQKLDYTVNEYARGLKSSKSKTIGVIIPELANQFMAQIITELENILRSEGYSVIICDCHTNEQLECEAVSFLLSKMVDGIINVPVCSDGKHLEPAISKNVPIIVLDRIIPELENKIDSVVINNSGATNNATKILLSKGHQKIAIILGPKHIYTTKQRLAGYLEAMKDFGIKQNDLLICYSDYTVEGGYSSMSKLLNGSVVPTAVLTTNHEMTLGAMISVNESSAVIPNDLSFIGFDNIDLSKVVSPRLTMIEQPLAEIGRKAAEIMLLRQKDNDGEAIAFCADASLIEGRSVSSPK